MIVSVVVPIFNQEYKVLSECIQSIIDQSHSDLEIILCNNYSDNGTEHLINNFAKLDERINVIMPHQFLNLGESFLFSLEQGSSEYICYLSSDDILEKDCIKIQLEFLLKNNNVDICHGKSLYFNEQQQDQISWDYYPKTGVYDVDVKTLNRIFKFEYVCFCGCLLRRSKLQKIIHQLKKMPFKLSLVLDTYILGELVKTSSIGFVNQIVGRVRTGNDISHRLLSVFEDCFNISNNWHNSSLTKSFFNIDEFNSIKDEYFNHIYSVSLRAYLNKKLNKDNFLLINNFVNQNNINIKKQNRLLSFFAINYPFFLFKLFKLFKSFKNLLNA